jgi:hypothetical protein
LSDAFSARSAALSVFNASGVCNAQPIQMTTALTCFYMQVCQWCRRPDADIATSFDNKNVIKLAAAPAAPAAVLVRKIQSPVEVSRLWYVA